MQSSRTTLRRTVAVGAAVSVGLALAGCGAGSRTGSETATQVDCDIEQPDEPITVNVLAYNSSAIDPFTNTMVASCSKGDVTLKHEPIDFGGQVQKTTATLSGSSGTYDIIETYGFVIPQFASEEKIEPLDDLFEKYSDDYDLDAINEDMRAAMSYDGSLYALPMQAQMFIMAYRKDVFDELGLEAPTTFEELREAAEKIQEEGDIRYPVALPWLASGDIATAYDAALGSLGVDFTDPDSMEANFDTPEAVRAFEELISLKPFMNPEVTTYDQPAVQQQMYNGSAAIAIMFSGRMNDLVQESNSQYADSFAFAPPPAVDEGGKQYSALSVDGWSIPANAATDRDALFQMIASSVSEEASEASVPAAYPAREGMVSEDSSAYAAAANDAINNAPPAEPYPWTSRISNDTISIVANVILGKTSPEEGTKKMQQIATDILAEYK
ncbi:ABC transporter substrate-binding protein [Nocardioides sp.]|uniref:ABC transporter substrate-binding protein n=1 Tax=Nocardioides sp. TaxID=35761 RepID=UPI002734B79A|nr:extracellular solute-binding protein [Nocardioides sp.]MDP3892704.1 extracellular solute-binding protein [Nocardioides sp.]